MERSNSPRFEDDIFYECTEDYHPTSNKSTKSHFSSYDVSSGKPYSLTNGLVERYRSSIFPGCYPLEARTGDEGPHDMFRKRYFSAQKGTRQSRIQLLSVSPEPDYPQENVTVLQTEDAEMYKKKMKMKLFSTDAPQQNVECD